MKPLIHQTLFVSFTKVLNVLSPRYTVDTVHNTIINANLGHFLLFLLSKQILKPKRQIRLFQTSVTVVHDDVCDSWRIYQWQAYGTNMDNPVTRLQFGCVIVTIINMSFRLWNFPSLVSLDSQNYLVRYVRLLMRCKLSMLHKFKFVKIKFWFHIRHEHPCLNQPSTPTFSLRGHVVLRTTSPDFLLCSRHDVYDH